MLRLRMTDPLPPCGMSPNRDHSLQAVAELLRGARENLEAAREQLQAIQGGVWTTQTSRCFHECGEAIGHIMTAYYPQETDGR
jgi:hypothetical protein